MKHKQIMNPCWMRCGALSKFNQDEDAMFILTSLQLIYGIKVILKEYRGYL